MTETGDLLIVLTPALAVGFTVGYLLGRRDAARRRPVTPTPPANSIPTFSGPAGPDHTGAKAPRIKS